MQQSIFTIKSNEKIARDVYRIIVEGKHDFSKPGQFAQIAVDGFYLRRPISICDYDENGFTMIYKVVGNGTEALSKYGVGQNLDIITGLGNGYDTSLAQQPILLGGGVGVPPLYGLAKQLRAEGKPVTVLLGFNEEQDVFYEKEFRDLGCIVHVATTKISRYHQGFAVDLLPLVYEYDYFYTCGPEPMLKAVYDLCETSGQLSFEARMACGFGACMGCSCATKYGNKRICKDGPVLKKEEVIW